MWVRLVETGRVVWCDDDLAVRWFAQGYAQPLETAAETPIPAPRGRTDVETR